MKIFVLLFLVGAASASFHEMLDDATHEYVLSFLEGLETAPSLAQHLGIEESSEAKQIEDDIKTELGKTLKEGIERILERVKDTVHEGKEVKQELIEKLRILREKLRQVKSELGDKGKELLKELKKQARDYLRGLLEKYGLQKRSVNDDRIEALFAEEQLNYKDLLRKVKEHLKKTVDPELMKEKIEKILGQGSDLVEHFLRTLKEKGKRKLEILIDALIGDDEEERESRSLKEYWEKVRDYFKDLKIDLQEKYFKFGEWVKEAYGKGLETSKDKLENIKAIAKEFAKHAKNVSKEVGAEASEFFRQYKDDLGNVWEELKEKFDEIRNRKDEE